MTCQKREQQRTTYSFRWGYGWQKQQTGGEEQPHSTSEAPDAASDSIVIDINDASIADDEGDVRDARKSYSTWMENATMCPFRRKWRYHWYALGYCVLLLPVPFSRVYLHDHFRTQVLYGSLIGIGAAFIWYVGFVRNCGMRVIEWRNSDWGKWWGLKFGWEEVF